MLILLLLIFVPAAGALECPQGVVRSGQTLKTVDCGEATFCYARFQFGAYWWRGCDREGECKEVGCSGKVCCDYAGTIELPSPTAATEATTTTTTTEASTTTQQPTITSGDAGAVQTLECTDRVGTVKCEKAEFCYEVLDRDSGYRHCDELRFCPKAGVDGNRYCFLPEKYNPPPRTTTTTTTTTTEASTTTTDAAITTHSQPTTMIDAITSTTTESPTTTTPALVCPGRYMPDKCEKAEFCYEVLDEAPGFGLCDEFRSCEKEGVTAFGWYCFLPGQYNSPPRSTTQTSTTTTEATTTTTTTYAPSITEPTTTTSQDTTSTTTTEVPSTTHPTTTTTEVTTSTTTEVPSTTQPHTTTTEPSTTTSTDPPSPTPTTTTEATTTTSTESPLPTPTPTTEAATTTMRSEDVETTNPSENSPDTVSGGSASVQVAACVVIVAAMLV